jgi:hypothetical protein
LRIGNRQVVRGQHGDDAHEADARVRDHLLAPRAPEELRRSLDRRALR